MIVCYRYLSGEPLDKNQQSSIYDLWYRRLDRGSASEGDTAALAPSACVDYFTYRAKIRHEKLKAGSTESDFSFAENIYADAYVNALENLKALVKKYGADSSPVKDWLEAQDMVFGANPTRTISEPPSAPANFDAYTKAQREYQIAAARFYAGDFDGAVQLFESLAKSANFPHKDLATYMAARAQANSAVPADDEAVTAKALTYVRGLLTAADGGKYFGALLDLAELLEMQIDDTETTMGRMVKAVMQPQSHRFGNDVADLTSLIDAHVISHFSASPKDATEFNKDSAAYRKNYELLDWLACMQQTDDLYFYQSIADQKTTIIDRKNQATHALGRWRKTKAITWLVAALCHNDILAANNTDLMQAAAHLGQTSPAYLTARFYFIDALIRSGRKSEARNLLQDVLSKNNLPPTSKNLFMRQNVSVSKYITEYFKAVVQPSLATTILGKH